jgi:hypothetical protein
MDHSFTGPENVQPSRPLLCLRCFAAVIAAAAGAKRGNDPLMPPNPSQGSSLPVRITSNSYLHSASFLHASVWLIGWLAVTQYKCRVTRLISVRISYVK